MIAIVLAVPACPSTSSDPPARGSAAAPAARPVPSKPLSPPSAPTGPLRIEWTHIVSTPGCFFFSGPDGRDEQMVGEVKVATAELEGTTFRVRVGTAVFEGTYSAGALDLVRDSEHDFDGPWKTHETLRGRQVDGELRATYRYEECKVGSTECPEHCTISANATFRR